MVTEYRIGDLVHIPQAVQLYDLDDWTPEDPQMCIPLRVDMTEKPRVGVVTYVSQSRDYLRVFCDGDTWAVKFDNVYSLERNT